VALISVGCSAEGIAEVSLGNRYFCHQLSSLFLPFFSYTFEVLYDLNNIQTALDIFATSGFESLIYLWVANVTFINSRPSCQLNYHDMTAFSSVCVYI